MWVHEKNNGLLYFISKNFGYNSSVACFSLDKTLISINSNYNNKKQNIDMMDLYCLNVVNFLLNIHKSGNGGSILIIDNQFGVSITFLKQKIGRFFKLIQNEKHNIPFLIIFSLKKNKFKKPNSNIWEKINKLYKCKTSEYSSAGFIDKNKSIVVGANAGRIGTYLYSRDFSDCDRAFADNVGIGEFRTPEQVFFRSDVIRKWYWNRNILSVENRRIFIKYQKTSIKEPKFTDLFKDYLERNVIIFITGPPTSGKTLFGNRVVKFLKRTNSGKKIIVFDHNQYTSSEIISLACDFIDKEYNNIIIIDKLNTKYKRNRYYKVFEKYHYKKMYIEIDTTREIAELLNYFKLQISTSPNIIKTPRHFYKDYYKNYEQPTTTFIKYPLLIRTCKEFWFHY